MKRLASLALGLALCAGTAWAADPVEGVWKTQPADDGAFAHVTISACGAEICGVLSKTFNASGSSVSSPNLGKQMIWGMDPKGDGKYRGGKIWAPDNDRTYNSRMELSGDSLKVQGCVLGICRGQTWSRVN